MVSYVAIVNGKKLKIIVAKLSIVDVCWHLEYVSVIINSQIQCITQYQVSFTVTIVGESYRVTFYRYQIQIFFNKQTINKIEE